MTTYSISQKGEERGPYTLAQLETMWNSGHVTADALYWTEGMTGWNALLELFEASSSRPSSDIEAASPIQIPDDDSEPEVHQTTTLKQPDLADNGQGSTRPASKLGACPECDGLDIENFRAGFMKNMSMNIDKFIGTRRCRSCGTVWRPTVSGNNTALAIIAGPFFVLLGFGAIVLCILGISVIPILALPGFIVACCTLVFGFNLSIFAVKVLLGKGGSLVILGTSADADSAPKTEMPVAAARDSNSSQLVWSGYVCSGLSLMVLPPVFGLAALVVGILNLRSGRTRHGVAQVMLSVVCMVAGFAIGMAR